MFESSKHSKTSIKSIIAVGIHDKLHTQAERASYHNRSLRFRRMVALILSDASSTNFISSLGFDTTTYLNSSPNYNRTTTTAHDIRSPHWLEFNTTDTISSIDHNIRKSQLSNRSSLFTTTVSLEFNSSTWLNTTKPASAPSVCIACGTFVTLLSIVTITVNILNLMILRKFKNFRLPTKYFLVSLSVADLAVGFSTPWYIHANIYGTWKLGEEFCTFLGLMFYMCLLVSIWHLMLLSFDRLLAIWKPIAYDNILSKNITIVFLIISWLICFTFIIIPVIGGGESYYFVESERMCGSSSYKSPKSMIVFGVFFAIPFTVTFICNIILWILVYKEINHLSSDTHIHSGQFRPDQRIKKQIKGAFTVAIVVIVFSITWLPCIVWNLHQAATGIQIPPVAEYTIMWMGVSNSSLNFFIFLATNRQFRTGFIRLVTCKSAKQERRETLYAVRSISHSSLNASNDSSNNTNLVTCHL